MESGIIDEVRVLENVVGVPSKSDWCEPSRAGPGLVGAGPILGWSLGHVVQEP